MPYLSRSLPQGLPLSTLRTLSSFDQTVDGYGAGTVGLSTIELVELDGKPIVDLRKVSTMHAHTHTYGHMETQKLHT